MNVFYNKTISMLIIQESRLLPNKYTLLKKEPKVNLCGRNLIRPLIATVNIPLYNRRHIVSNL